MPRGRACRQGGQSSPPPLRTLEASPPPSPRSLCAPSGGPLSSATCPSSQRAATGALGDSLMLGELERLALHAPLALLLEPTSEGGGEIFPKDAMPSRFAAKVLGRLAKGPKPLWNG